MAEVERELNEAQFKVETAQGIFDTIVSRMNTELARFQVRAVICSYLHGHPRCCHTVSKSPAICSQSPGLLSSLSKPCRCVAAWLSVALCSNMAWPQLLFMNHGSHCRRSEQTRWQRCCVTLQLRKHARQQKRQRPGTPSSQSHLIARSPSEVGSMHCEAGSMHCSVTADAVAVFRGCQHSSMLCSHFVLRTSILLVPYFS